MSRNSKHDAGRVGGALRGLLAVNGALLVLLGAVTFSPLADAQVRARGNYTMAGGRINGAPAAAVFIVDTTNQELIALTYEPSQRELLGIGYRNLAVDARATVTGGGGR